MLEQHLRGTFEPSRNMTRMVLDNWTVQSSKWLWMTWVILQPGTLGMEVIGCRGFCAEPYSWYISNTNISKPFGGGMNVQMGSLTCATLNLEFLFREVPHFFVCEDDSKPDWTACTWGIRRRCANHHGGSQHLQLSCRKLSLESFRVLCSFKRLTRACCWRWQWAGDHWGVWTSNVPQLWRQFDCWISWYAWELYRYINFFYFINIIIIIILACAFRAVMPVQNGIDLDTRIIVVYYWYDYVTHICRFLTGFSLG